MASCTSGDALLSATKFVAQHSDLSYELDRTMSFILRVGGEEILCHLYILHYASYQVATGASFK